MKDPSLKFIFFFMSFFVVVGLACGLSTQPDSTATSPPVIQVEEEPEAVVQEPAVVEEVVEPPAPTDPPMRQIPPTETPELIEEITEEPYDESEEESSQTTGLDFFVEEFDRDPGWYFDVIQGDRGGNPNSVSYNFNFGRMIFDIPERDLYAYYIYDGVTYDSVRLDINYENRGVNSQQVSLICQMSDEGWYEFAVQSDGLWKLYAVTSGYDPIARGGSKFIKTGKEINEYTLICEGNTLSFFINGVEPTGSPHIDRKYALRWGEVGFSVSSLQATPVKVEVDWFAITPP